MKKFVKHPDAVKDYKIKWAKWLGTDTISTSSWSTVDNITIDSDTNDTTSATVILSGGNDGDLCCIENTITTANGLTEVKAIHIKIDSCKARDDDY